ncbi:MAG: protein kinase [Phycisphaerales bacterium]
MSGRPPQPDPKKAEEVFLAVADLPREHAEGVLRERCAGDGALEALVRELLGFHAQGEGVLDKPELLTKGVPFFRRDLAEETLPAGTRLGEYVIEKLIGTGGMGSVYLATQDRPRRTVALKVIRRGVATAAMIRRFEHEAEVLGRLQHPGIAQIYEAGAAAVDPGEYPQPYIAMEFIDGESLSAHSKSHGLSCTQKLELMARVCDAVQHAHQRGVIHRDLKPGNILVDRAGQPKILDFGVARAADADLRVVTLQTSVGQLIGTLPYMSPEQVLADPSEVDTRSDVYALGVMLYELLTGKLPLDVGSRPIPEAARLIREETPSRLSSVSREYRGDVETIVAKAMDKQKRRRYQSAAELAGDIRLHLRGMPISAKQDSAWYVLVKQAQRHRVVAGVGAALLASLLAFTVYASVQAGRFQRLARSESLAKSAAEGAGEVAAREAARANEQAERLNDQLYASNIERGRLLGLAGNLVQAEDILWRGFLARPFNARGRWALWEFYERHPCRWSRSAFPAGASLVCVSPTGEIAVASETGEIAIYEPARGDEIRRWIADTRLPLAMRFSADGRSLVVVKRTAVVSTFDLATVADPTPPPKDVPIPSPTGGIAFGLSRDGTRFALWKRGGELIIMRTSDGSVTQTLRDDAADQASCLAFSDAGDLLAIGTAAGVLKVMKLATGETVRMWTTEPGSLIGLDFSDDGSLVAAGHRSRFVRVMRVSDGEVVGTFRSELAASRYVEFSPDGRTLMGSDVGATCIWDIRDGRLTREIAMHRGGGAEAAWTRDGNGLVSTGRDGMLRMWEPTSVPGTRDFEGHTSWVFGAATSPVDGTLASVGGEGAVRFWNRDGSSLGELKVSMARIRVLLFTPDGSRMFAGGADGKVHVIDPVARTELASFDGPNKAEVSSLTLTPDGSRLVVGGYTHVIAIHRTADLSLETTLTLPRTAGAVRSLLITRDGKTMYTDGCGPEVCVFDLPSLTLRERLTGPAVLRNLSLSEDTGRLAAGMDDGRISLWDIKTGQFLATLDGHSTGVWAVAFSPTGRVLASGSDDSTVKLWDPASGAVLVSLAPGRGEVPFVSFSPDGHMLIASFQNRTFRTWDLLHYNLSIVGNIDHQIERLSGELDPSVDLTGIRNWAAQIRRQVPAR